MSVQVSSAAWTAAAGDWLVVGVPEGPTIDGPLGALNQALGGQIARLIERRTTIPREQILKLLGAPRES